MNKEERLKIYEEVQKEIKEEQNIHIPFSEIHSIVESQFKIMMYGFTKGIGSHLPMIGKFIPFDMDFYSENVILPNKELQRKLREEGNEEEATIVFKDSISRYKKVVKEKGQEETIKAVNIIKIPNVDGSTDTLDLFKSLR